MAQYDLQVVAKLHGSYTRIIAKHYPNANNEIWLNPRDREAIGQPDLHQLFGLPVHVSIGITAGEVAIFDRSRCSYLRDPTPE